jgi:prepilin-type N-terminal cleavage/methylation domain-containing protein
MSRSELTTGMYARRAGVKILAKRSGFTLLETLLALTLAALLMGGIFTAMNQSWRLTASGHEEMQRAQLARALIHRFEVDLRAITYVPPTPYDETAEQVAAAKAESAATSTSTSGSSSGSGSGGGSGSSSGGSSGGGSSSGSSTSSSTSTTSTTPTEPTVPVPNSKPIGLRGTSQQLEMSISRPRRDYVTIIQNTNQSSTAGELHTMSSDLREITYTFLPPGSSPSGLFRTEGNRMAVESAESAGGSAMQASALHLVAPEVAALRFRFFDGRAWYDVWDSDTVSRVPRAVEVTIGFAPPQQKKTLFSAAVSRSLETFRAVILIPVSDPYPKDFIQ